MNAVEEQMYIIYMELTGRCTSVHFWNRSLLVLLATTLNAFFFLSNVQYVIFITMI